MIKRFLSFVEIRTKVTTSCSFLLALAYLEYRAQIIDWTLTLIFFFSMMIMDCATTATNNYMDTKTNGLPLQFERKTALRLIWLMFLVSIAGGLYLVYCTDLVVLLLGGLCFLSGVLYTWGPVPISRMPLGELISGVVQGGVGPFLALYINMPAGTYMTLGFSKGTIVLSLNVLPLIAVLLLTIPPMCTIAGIMLANNICDRERDIAVQRYTLAYYLKRKALYLFAGLYYTCYAADVLLVILEMAPPILLLILVTIIPVQINIRKFFQKQEKRETFPLSISNFLIIIGANILLFLICPYLT